MLSMKKNRSVNVCAYSIEIRGHKCRRDDEERRGEEEENEGEEEMI